MGVEASIAAPIIFALKTAATLETVRQIRQNKLENPPVFGIMDVCREDADG